MDVTSTQPQPLLSVRLVNAILAIKPLAKFLKWQARNIMIKQAKKIGVSWQETVEQLRDRDWQTDLDLIQNPQLNYPEHYVRSFHGYEQGHLSWQAAWECQVAATTVHSRLWPEIGGDGERQLRQNYHDLILSYLANPPQNILDIHCTAGMSAFALQDVFPQAQVTGIDFSPYYLAVAKYNAQARKSKINWLHTLPESTGLPNGSFDHISAFLFFHELPQSATLKVLQEIYRLLPAGGCFSMTDSNPQADFYRTLPAYVMTILKSTEPYLDEYFSLDFPQALKDTGFQQIEAIAHSQRYRTILARKLENT